MANSDVQRVNVEDIIRDTVHGVTDCLENGHKQTKHTSPSIFMAPDTLRSLSPSSFQPQVVSIGPLHRKQPNLQAFEVKKAEFVGKLLDRLKPDIPRSQTLEACVQKVADSIDRIRECYPSIKTYTDVDLAIMMVMDACFILEFLHPFQDAVVRANPDDDVSEYFPEFLDAYDPHIPYDLVLLENQIPFFVLNDIFHCTISKIEGGCSLTEYIQRFLKFLIPIQTSEMPIGNSHEETPHHILGLLYHCYIPPNIHHGISFQEYCLYPKKRSAIELDQAGVNFERSTIDASCPLAMNVEMHTFPWSWVLRPTLRMPALTINHFTELVLRNLIAYEQYFPDLRDVSSYAMAMDMLIDSQEDIARLVKSKVIVNHLGTNQDAANMINNICKLKSWGTFLYYDEWKKLDRHCNTYWPSKILLLRRTYFNNPWSIIALLTAIGLFVLTLIQTVCTLIQTVYTIT